MTDLPHDSAGLTRRQAVAAAAALTLTQAARAQAQTAQAAQAQAQAQTAQAASTATASGTVFEDTDGSGRRAPGARMLPGVMVSNGRDVVTTGADGQWSLPVLPGDSVFVIKPTGYITPVDPVTQLPRYAYLHQPDGTPASLDTRFAGVAPTGPMPASIDFALRKQAEPARFSAILFTDPQPESLAELGYVRDDVVAVTAGVDAAFGITTGDIMFDDLSYYGRHNRIVGTIGVPWYNCCGNHDMNLEAPDNTHSRETFKRVFGARYSAMQYGGATFFLLDNVDYLGTDPARPNGFGKYRGHFGADQIGFVRNVLANVPTDSLVVVCFHIPLRTLVGAEPNVSNVDTADLLAAIASHPHTVSFCGHTHTNEHWYLDMPGGGQHHHHVLAAVSGSWWSGPFDERGIPVALQTDGTPNGFHVLSVDGVDYQTTLVPAREPAGAAMRIVLDGEMHRADPEVLHEYPIGALLRGPITQAAAGATRVVVNLFDGGQRSKVTMTLGAGTPIPMTRTQRRDPFVDEVYARNAATRKPWVKPEPSTHIWQAHLPGTLPAGTHRLTVAATDEHGRPHTAWMVLEVTG